MGAASPAKMVASQQHDVHECEQAARFAQVAVALELPQNLLALRR